MRMMMGVTYGLKPDGQTTLVGESGDVNKTFSPPLDFRIMMVSHGRTASDNIKQRRAWTFHYYPNIFLKKA
jgi:hypothetical protein